MRAIVLSEYGSPDVLQFKEVAKPVPEDNEVLVRVHASSVNMADVDYLLGRPKATRLGTGLHKPRNSVLGLDASGRVEAVGILSNTEQAHPRLVRFFWPRMYPGYDFTDESRRALADSGVIVAFTLS